MSSPAQAHSRILAVARRVPVGRVATYGQVATLAGEPRRARLVGRVMATLSAGSDVPWQRIVNGRGEISARGGGRGLPGLAEGYQRHLLEEEGVVFDRRGRIDLERFGWEPQAPPGRSTESAAAATRRAVHRIAARLRPLGSRRRAAGAKAYLKSDLEFYGLDTAALRGAAAAWLRANRALARADLVALAAALWAEPVHELRAFAIELLLRHADDLAAADLALLESMLRRARSWAYVDVIAIHLVGPLIERRPGLERVLDRWAKDGDFWIRRAAVLALVLPFRRGGGDWPRFTRYADAMLGEREFFIRKALGWTLREAAKRQPERVARFVAARLGAMSGVTFREAVRPLPPAVRRRLEDLRRRSA